MHANFVYLWKFAFENVNLSENYVSYIGIGIFSYFYFELSQAFTKS